MNDSGNIVSFTLRRPLFTTIPQHSYAVPMNVTRRAFLAWISSLAAAILTTGVRPASGEEQSIGSESPEEPLTRPGAAIGRYFSGETLAYTMSFLWFNKAASCTVTCREADEPGVYEAIIAGQTHGVIGAFTRFRRDILTARMEEVDGGERFRPLEFREDVIVGGKQRRKTTRFDYDNRRITIIRERKGTTKEKTLPLPPGEQYYDPLTASYNFRFGSFGPVERGRRYVIKTVPEKKLTEIHVAVAAPDEEKRQKRPHVLGDDHGYVVHLRIDKEIVRSTSGKIEGWLSEALIPLEGRIRDVILFGDVVGRNEEPEKCSRTDRIPASS